MSTAILVPLTNREQQVAAVAAQGYSAQRVASILSLSKRTVEGHIASIYGKLGISSRDELIDHMKENTP